MDSLRFEAAKRGEKHFDGTPCRRCGATLRYVMTGSCVECTKAKSLAHRLKVQEKLREIRGDA